MHILATLNVQRPTVRHQRPLHFLLNSIMAARSRTPSSQGGSIFVHHEFPLFISIDLVPTSQTPNRNISLLMLGLESFLWPDEAAHETRQLQEPTVLRGNPTWGAVNSSFPARTCQFQTTAVTNFLGTASKRFKYHG